jgi:hypothetical protein
MKTLREISRLNSRALKRFHDARCRAGVVLERLGDVNHLYAGTATGVFVERSFINILESSSTAYVVHQNHGEFGGWVFNVHQQLDESRALAQRESADADIFIAPNDADIVGSGIPSNRLPVENRGALLMVCRHAHVLRGAYRRGEARPIALSRQHSAYRLTAMISDSAPAFKSRQPDSWQGDMDSSSVRGALSSK